MSGELEVRQGSPVATTGGSLPARPSTDVSDLIRVALMTPEIQADKLTSLYDLQERVQRRDAEAQFNQAFAALQLELPRIPKNGIIDMGSKGRMNFAKWEDMDAVIRPILAAHGFVLSFSSEPAAGAVLMICTLTHVGGHSRISKMQLPPDTGAGRNNLQAMGSSRSYGKRYLTADILNLVFVGQDNDGKTAEPITKEQADQIRCLLDEIGVPPNDGKFLRWLHDGWGADSITHIQQPHFAQIVAGLEEKRRAKR